MKPMTGIRQNATGNNRLPLALTGIAAALALSTLPATSHAQGLYFGGNYSAFQFTDDSSDDEIIKPGGAALRLGIGPTRGVGLEARGGVGLPSGKRDRGGRSRALDVDALGGG